MKQPVQNKSNIPGVKNIIAVASGKVRLVRAPVRNWHVTGWCRQVNCVGELSTGLWTIGQASRTARRWYIRTIHSLNDELAQPTPWDPSRQLYEATDQLQHQMHFIGIFSAGRYCLCVARSNGRQLQSSHWCVLTSWTDHGCCSAAVIPSAMGRIRRECHSHCHIVLTSGPGSRAWPASWHGWHAVDCHATSRAVRGCHRVNTSRRRSRWCTAWHNNVQKCQRAGMFSLNGLWSLTVAADTRCHREHEWIHLPEVQWSAWHLRQRWCKTDSCRHGHWFPRRGNAHFWLQMNLTICADSTRPCYPRYHRPWKADSCL